MLLVQVIIIYLSVAVMYGLIKHQIKMVKRRKYLMMLGRKYERNMVLQRRSVRLTR